MNTSVVFDTTTSRKPLVNSETPRRVVIVRGTASLEHLAEWVKDLGFICKIVPSYLSALGEVSTEPVDVVIGPADAWRGSLHTIVRSARALSVGVRLVAVCDTQDTEQASEAVAAGFDDLLYPPFQTQVLAELLTGRKLEASSTPDPSNGVNAALEITATHSTGDNNQEASEELGDVDLIDAILSTTEDVADVAVRLIELHTGMRGVGLRPVDGEPPEGQACVSVIYRGISLALLHASPPATEDQLSPWAEWLGRWLALRDQISELNGQALRDELTGVWNRRYFNRFLDRILHRATSDRSHVTLLVFDIDDFKLYNDKHGHGVGDDVLRETARLMQSVVREHDVVARIGGDEFAVIFWDNDKPRKPNSEHPQDVVSAARRFQEAICSHRFPKLLDKAVGRLTVSGGLASFPWDGRTHSELLERADAMALQSKRQGKNAITFGTGSKRSTP